MKHPRISVVMPVHNGLPFLDQSIISILEQTFTDFELVILNDASTDGSDEVLREWQARDDRIRLHHSDRKLGLGGKLESGGCESRWGGDCAHGRRRPFSPRSSATAMGRPAK